MVGLKRLKYALIRAGFEGISLLGSLALSTKARGRGIIFTLHHVRPDDKGPFQPNRILSVTPRFLEEAIKASLECGLIPVRAEDLPDLLSDPSDERRFVSFTLDDGYRNNAEYAAPVFAKYNVPYTIFLTSGFVERTHSLWWETTEVLLRQSEELAFDFGKGVETIPLHTKRQKLKAFDKFAVFVGTNEEMTAVARIDELARANGIDPLQLAADLTMDENEIRELAKDPLANFGAHTVSHRNLRRLSDDDLRTEIVESVAAVERYVGKAPRIFAYPYGFKAAVGEREIKAVADAGVPMAVTTQPGILKAENLERPTAFNRVSLNGASQKPRYVKAMISGLAFKFV